MQYLPYTQEQTWQEQIYPNGYNGQYIGTEQDWPAELPLTYGLGERFWNNVDNGNYLSAAGDVLLVPFAGITDVAGGAVNTAVNGYKRLYNNAAALYNNVAGAYNTYNTPTIQQPMQTITVQQPTQARQTSLTGRLWTPSNIRRLPTIPQQKKVYLMGNNGQVIAGIY